MTCYSISTDVSFDMSSTPTVPCTEYVPEFGKSTELHDVSLRPKVFSKCGWVNNDSVGETKTEPGPISVAVQLLSNETGNTVCQNTYLEKHAY